MAILDALFREVRDVVTEVTIKYSNKARKMETIESRQAYDRYKMCLMKNDKFETYKEYEPEVILYSGITQDKELAKMYGSDPSLIPDGLRTRVLLAMRRWTIDNYVEQNDYYRELMGLPKYGDTEGVYAPSDFYEMFEIDFKPVHMLTDDEFVKLRESNIWERLVMENPDKPYLKYIGLERVNLMTARESENFQLLKYKQTSNDVLNSQFTTFYEQNRRYMMAVTYNKDYSVKHELYDNYMGMMLMIMVVQRILVNTFKNGIERDFYDPVTLSLLFESYNVPFIESIPLHQQQLIAKNLNKLLHFKSTDKVIYDLSAIMGFERANIYRYLLIKEHKVDIKGNPIFETKEVEDIEGAVDIVPDYDKMFNYYFQTVDIREYDVSNAITNRSGRIPYEEVVNPDAFWWSEDPEIMEKIHKEEFNYLDTKYLKMEMIYQMTDVLFEITHFFRLLLDQKDMRGIRIHMPRLGINNTHISYFESAIALAHLLSKKHGLRGEILYSTTKIMTVMGFDFKFNISAFLNTLTPDQLENPVIKRLSRSIVHMDAHTAQDINALYTEIDELNSIILERMADTNDRSEYLMLYDLHRALFYTENNQNIFRKSNGELAETYGDFLEDYNRELFNGLEMDSDEEKINSLIDHILYRLEVEVGDLKYIHTLNDGMGALSDALVRLIRFFKSYTIDMTSFNIIYVFGSRTTNRLKLIDEINSMKAQMHFYDSVSLLTMMEIAFLSSQFSMEDKIQILEYVSLEALIHFNEKYIPSKFLLHSMKVDMSLYEDINNHIVDKLALVSNTIHKKALEIRNEVIRHGKINFIEDELLINKIKYILESLIGTNEHTKLIDIITMLTTAYHKRKILILEEFMLLGNISIEDDWILEDKYFIDSFADLSTSVGVIDKEYLNSIIHKNKHLGLNETYEITALLKKEDKTIDLEKYIELKSNIQAYDNVTLGDIYQLLSVLFVKKHLGIAEAYEIVTSLGLNDDMLKITDVVIMNAYVNKSTSAMLYDVNEIVSSITDGIDLSLHEAYEMDKYSTLHSNALRLHDRALFNSHNTAYGDVYLMDNKTLRSVILDKNDLGISDHATYDAYLLKDDNIPLIDKPILMGSTSTNTSVSILDLGELFSTVQQGDRLLDASDITIDAYKPMDSEIGLNFEQTYHSEAIQQVLVSLVDSARMTSEQKENMILSIDRDAYAMNAIDNIVKHIGISLKHGLYPIIRNRLSVDLMDIVQYTSTRYDSASILTISHSISMESTGSTVYEDLRMPEDFIMDTNTNQNTSILTMHDSTIECTLTVIDRLGLKDQITTI